MNKLLNFIIMKKRLLVILFLVNILSVKVNAQVEATTGKVTLLRINRVGGSYGPASDKLDAEVIIKMSSKPDYAFGFQLRKDNDEITHQAMLTVLRESYNSDRNVKIEYTREGSKKNLFIIRVILEK